MLPLRGRRPTRCLSPSRRSPPPMPRR